MTKEELLKRLHEILEIVGPDRAFEISENTNERKTLWIHQTPGEDEYLMLSATKLFPISTIRNIVYEYGEDIGSYSDTDFILCFELNGDCDYTVEFGGGFENGTYVIYYDGNRWHATEEDTDWLKKYNERMRVKESMSRLIWTAAEFSKEANAERQLIARAAIKKASTLAYLPCHADIDLKLLDLIHIAYTDGIQKSDLYRYDSQTFNIIISGETGELLCKYDES